MLVSGVIFFRAATNGGHTDAISVSEVNSGRRHGLAILHLEQRHPVLAPDFVKGIAPSEESGEPVGIGFHCIGIDRVQRNQNVIASLTKAADPVLRRTWSGIAHQRCARGGSSGKRTERLERNVRSALLDLPRNHSRPGNSDVQATVRPAATRFPWLVSRARP